MSAASWCDLSSQRQLKFIQLQHFYLSLVTGSDDSDEYQTPSELDLTQNISTVGALTLAASLHKHSMVQTFSYRTETPDKSFHHTIHSVDLGSSVGKWVRQLEDLQTQVYSFDKSQVENIKQQFLDGQLKAQLDKEPYFLTYKINDTFQLVNIDRVDKSEPDFIAKVTYLTAAEGGRKDYAASGYRPHVKFDGQKELTSGEQLFVDKEKVFPGDTVTAEIRIVSVDSFKNHLFVGQHFEVAGASHLVGHGEIIEVINPDLKQASR